MTDAPVAALAIDQRLAAAGILQEILTDTIDLGLQAKQLHWNLRGPMFHDVHVLLDELAAAAGEASDTLAERCLALGVAADGRIATLAGSSQLDPAPEGRISDRDAVDIAVARLHTLSEVGRSRLGQLGQTDPVSQDMVIQILGRMEKLLWMFESSRI
jgi:starvation-inducible DNA-binding protein